MFSSNLLAASSTLLSTDIVRQSSASRLVVIDAGVENAQLLILGIDVDAAVLSVHAEQDGIAQITSALQQLPHLRELHIVAHGAPGKLQLGNGELSLTTLPAHGSALATWFSHPEAELLLYSCNLAAGDAGEEFVRKLQVATGAKVAASSTKVGSDRLGGNWSLDVTTTDFVPQLAFSAAARAGYPDTLTWFQAEKLLADATINNVPGNTDPFTTSEGDLDNFDQFGSSVAIFDGFAFVGVPDNADVANPNYNPNLPVTFENQPIVPGNDVGSVYVFKVDPNNGSWSRETQLTASDPVLNAFFGESIDATKLEGSDDLYLVVGAPGAREEATSNDRVGAAYVFRRDTAGNWQQVEKITNSGTISDRFGASVGIDGQSLVIGAPGESRPNSALNPDGTPASPLNQAGSIYIYESQTGSGWSQTAKILNPSDVTVTNNVGTAVQQADFDRFGQSVAIADGLIIAGAPNAEAPNAEAPNGQVTAGAAYIFQQVNGVWQTTPSKKLIARDDSSAVNQQAPETGDGFGTSVDIVDGYAIVGSPGNDIVLGDVGTQQQRFVNAGAAYIFQAQPNGDWTQTPTLTGTEGPFRAGDQFGISVGIDDSIAIVGSYTEDVDFADPTIPANSIIRSEPGASFIYELDDQTGDWEETQRLISDNTTDDPRLNGDSFGYAVDVYTSAQGSSSVIVGANTKNFIRDGNDFAVNPPETNGRADIAQAGAAYIFRSQPQVVGLQVNTVALDSSLLSIPALPASGPFIADAQANVDPRKLHVRIFYDQPMNQADINKPIVEIRDFVDPAAAGLAGSLDYAPNESFWDNPNTFVAVYDIGDVNVDIDGLDFRVDGAKSVNGADQIPAEPAALDFLRDVFSIDTDNPELVSFRSFRDDTFNRNSPPLTYTNQSFLVAGSFDQQIFAPNPTGAIPVAPIDASIIAPLTNGSIANFNFDGGGTFSFQVDLSSAAEGDVDIDIPLNSIVDEATNPNFQSGSIDVIYDITAPTVELALGIGQANPTNAAFDVFINIDDNLSPMENLGENDIVVTSGNANIVSGSFRQVDLNNPKQYAVTVDPTISIGLEGTINVAIGAGSFNDLAGNANDQAAEVSLFYDGIRPTVTIEPPTTTEPGIVVGPFSVLVRFSEPVTDFTPEDLIIGPDPANPNAIYTGSVDNGDGTYSIGFAPISAGDVSISIGENAALDAAGNTSTASNLLTLDYQPPNPQVIRVTPSVLVLADSDADGVFTLTVSFSEDMDQEQANFPIINFPTVGENPRSPDGNVTISPTSGQWIDARTFEQTYTVRDSNLFISEIDVSISNAKDIDGNGIEVGREQIDNVFGVDMANPTVVLTPTGSVAEGYTIQATFSEVVTGFDESDITVINGQVVSASFTGSDADYSFQVTPIDPLQDVQVTISDEVIDFYGNAGVSETIVLSPSAEPNDPPTITLPTNSAATPGNKALLFSSATGTGIVVADPDAETVQVTITASRGVLSMAGRGNGLVSFTAGDGFADSTLQFTGTLANVNAALEGLLYKPGNRNGTTTLTFEVNDLGNTGTGGELIDREILTVDVSRNVPKDFNFDGNSDIVWRNRATGQNSFWGMLGTIFLGSSPPNDFPTQTDTNWEIVGSADFNQDNRPDILWRNLVTGENVVWYFNGTAFSGVSDQLLTVGDTNWQIKGTGDFSADGKVDILWRNSATGENVLWFMDGSRQIQSAFATGVPDLTWEIGGATDFDGDGQADIIWRNQVSGRNVIWIMEGGLFLAGVELPVEIDQNWEIVGTGDYNSDGFDDLLWRNYSTGENRAWLMNGTEFTNSVPISRVSDTNWYIGQN